MNGPLPDNAIELKEITKWYGQVIGVNNVSISVGPGVTGLLGPNGAGKSTIMKLVTGQILPSQGDVRLCEKPPFFDRGVKANMGYVPELDALPDHETGPRFLQKRAILRGYSPGEAARLADETLERVDHAAARHKKIGGYSRGMRQRVKLAQAVFHDPGVLILDEPLTGMDPMGRRDVIDLIRDLGERGRCVLVSSHILHEVEAMTDNVILIARGKILAEGTIDHIRGLIDQHPHTVDIGTANATRLSMRLLELGVVVSASLEDGDGKVQVRTRDPDRFYDALCSLVVDEGFEVESMHSPDNNLQAVFNYLVK
jgi:ABC-2 type transport system ATP-binding protein